MQKNLLLGQMAIAGITQADLAKRINISHSTLNAKINGHRYFDTDEILKICDVLNIQDEKDKVNIFLR